MLTPSKSLTLSYHLPTIYIIPMNSQQWHLSEQWHQAIHQLLGEQGIHGKDLLRVHGSIRYLLGSPVSASLTSTNREIMTKIIGTIHYSEIHILFNAHHILKYCTLILWPYTLWSSRHYLPASYFSIKTWKRVIKFTKIVHGCFNLWTFDVTNLSLTR